MFLILILHSLGQGGILENAEINSIQYKFSWFLEIFAYCAVNIFGLISGYVSYTDKEKQFKVLNYLKIWLEVVFYGIIITLIFNLRNPELVSIKDYITVLLPVSNGLYWYFSAYTALFIIMPFLNRGIRACSNKTLKKIFVIIILVFSIFDTVVNRFSLNKGYSFVWLTILYILGAIIKKCEIGKNFKNYKVMISIIILYIVTYIYKIYGIEISNSDISITKSLLVSYISPTILGASILYIIMFSKMNFHLITKNIIKFAAPTAFSIYIINNHRLFWTLIMKDLFVDIANQSILTIFVYVFGFSALFAIACVFIDNIRLLLFKMLHLDVLINKISNKINELFNRCVD